MKRVVAQIEERELWKSCEDGAHLRVREGGREGEGGKERGEREREREKERGREGERKSLC